MVTPLRDPETPYTVGKVANKKNVLVDAGFNKSLSILSQELSVRHPSISYNSLVMCSLVACSAYRKNTLLAYKDIIEAAPIRQCFLSLQAALFKQGEFGLRIGNSISYLQEPTHSFRDVLTQYELILDDANVLLPEQHYCSQFKKPVIGTILMIDMQLPKPDIDAGSYAAYQEIKLIQSLGYHIKFLSAHLEYDKKYSRLLQNHGVEVLYGPHYSSAKEAIVQNISMLSGVYITRYHIADYFLSLIKEHAPNLPIVFNNADLHFLREMREAEVANDLIAMEKANNTKQAEVNVMEQVDAVLSYNETEHEIITPLVKNPEKIFKCPWVLAEKNTIPSYKERSGISFLGGFNHAPNRQALDYFLSEIMPVLIKRVPKIKLFVYGSHLPDKYRAMSSDHIEFVGYVENLDDVFNQHRVFVAPLLAGAGIKGKVLEALSYGVPAVLSPIAAEATGHTHQETGFVVNHPQDWADCIANLIEDDALWHKLSKNSQVLASRKYSFENGQCLMRKAFQYVGLSC